MTMSWLYLLLAGLLEIVWAIMLKYTEGFTRLVPSVVTVATMIISFYFLANAAKELPIGTAYAIWAGIGAVGTALVGIFLLGEPVNPMKIVSLLFVVTGIMGLKYFTT